MLISSFQNYRRMTKPIVCFWLLCSSMVFCAFSSTSPVNGSENTVSAGKPLADLDHLTDQPATSVALANPHDAHGHHALPQVDNHNQGHHHGMDNQLSEHHSSGSGYHGSHHHDSDCCGEVQATSSFGFFVDIPASAVLLILLVICFRNSGLRFHGNHSIPPPWSPPPITLLHCSFLK